MLNLADPHIPSVDRPFTLLFHYGGAGNLLGLHFVLVIKSPVRRSILVIMIFNSGNRPGHG